MELQFRKYPPSRDLADFVRFYYTISNHKEAANTLMDNHPQGAIDMIFALNGGITFSNPKLPARDLGQVFLIGMQDHYFLIDFPSDIELVGVTFTALGFSKIFRMPMKEMTNNAVEITDLLQGEEQFLLERLNETNHDLARMAVLEDFFRERIARNETLYDTTDHAIIKVAETMGMKSVKELAEEMNLNPRTLQRKFMEKIGTGPKTYARVMRFRTALRLLQQEEALEVQDILFRCGYYDQMHFIKEFKQFTGRTPSSYLSSKNKLGDFFLGLE